MTRLAAGISLWTVLALAAAPALAQEAPSGYHLVWADEFDAPGLPDPAKWSYDTDRNKDGWWNNEAQYYAADRPENSRVENGNLVIEARKEDLSTLPDWGGQHYTSARLVTRGKASWTYGFFDIRAKLPCGVGQWPAIWMLGDGPWPDAGEIDIMESIGFEPTTIYGTLHSAYSVANGEHNGDKVEVPTLCSAFHNYQMEWTPAGITFLVDDRPFYHKDKGSLDHAHYPFDGPQSMLLNLAIGGNWGGQHGIDDNALPARMEVDYVRVYQK